MIFGRRGLEDGPVLLQFLVQGVAVGHMPDPTYTVLIDTPPPSRKAFIRQHGEIKTPPFSAEGRKEAGVLIGRLQDGESIGMPASRPMPTVGAGCHELRVRDGGHHWRLMYFIDADAVVLLDVFPKKTRKTPVAVIDRCQARLSAYLAARSAAKKEADGA